jgi:hypothetical protein
MERRKIMLKRRQMNSEKRKEITQTYSPYSCSCFRSAKAELASETLKKQNSRLGSMAWR